MSGESVEKKPKSEILWKSPEVVPGPAKDGLAVGMAVHVEKEPFKPWTYPLPTYFTGDDHVEMKVTHCGVCHSDIHTVNGDWGAATWPMVPGHEVVGIAVKVGKNVKHVKVGDRVAAGPQSFSCQECGECKADYSQYCDEGWKECFGTKLPDGGFTFGGYGSYHRSVGAFTHKIPDNLSSAGAAPLLCAGITTYLPLRNADVKGKKVAVVGVGGLGHLAVKFAAAMGAEVTCISRSSDKEALFKSLGASGSINASDLKKASEENAIKFDVMLNTISSTSIDFNLYLAMLKARGTFIQVGAGPGKMQIAPPTMIMKGRSLVGSLVGSPQQTREMLDFCSTHGIEATVEVVPVAEVNTAVEKVNNSTAHFRMVVVHPGHENDL